MKKTPIYPRLTTTSRTSLITGEEAVLIHPTEARAYLNLLCGNIFTTGSLLVTLTTKQTTVQTNIYSHCDPFAFKASHSVFEIPFQFVYLLIYLFIFFLLFMAISHTHTHKELENLRITT